MCIVAIALKRSARYPLILAANRDELHSRPAAAAAWWADQPNILAGRDLVAGGSWLGISRLGRLAAVTNVFQPEGGEPRRSRGELVRDFLSGATDRAPGPGAAGEYGPFRFFSLDVTSGYSSAQISSNRECNAQLEQGLHVFSNNPPLMPWTKTGYVLNVLERLSALDDPSAELFALLQERGTDTASSVFVLGRKFGTRCSTVVTIDAHGEARLTERSFDPAGRETGRVGFNFNL